MYNSFLTVTTYTYKLQVLRYLTVDLVITGMQPENCPTNAVFSENLKTNTDTLVSYLQKRPKKGNLSAFFGHG